MNPFYFGERSRRLFGLYSPAHATGGKQRGIVLCPPWGQEYLRSHRSMRQLGDMLTASGHHVLRFDYFGTGDSAGDMAQADLKGWLADVETAIDELKDTAGLQRVGLLGLRLGATLAAQAAAKRRRDVDALVLWDPVLSGRDHLAEMRLTDAAVRDWPVVQPTSDTLELLGFCLNDTLTRDIESIDLLASQPQWPARSFMAVSEGLPAHAGLQPAFEGVGTRAMELIESQPAWLEDRDSGAGAVPVKVLQRIVQWLG